ncbi:ArnT family glycosyltransferase [Amycolatopsis nigrescens]|uniref:ArnT family glycosyltransferase n=1 Tax=Amycolatopsis nigrescens TaxID=381445 RepID=UPI000369CCE9|nr:glycosyltransferase family 39 protein [Amycolatopsis nigrescens]
MTAAAHPIGAAPEPPTTEQPERTRRQRVALGAILLLALAVNGWGIASAGWGNAFYSAAVRSMSENLTNFVFGAFDPAGVTTVDKPPMALWPQVFSTWIFGFHGWSLLLPQVLEGGAAVFLLHRTVRRWAGENAALLAALALALTPMVVAVNRSNLPDALLLLLGVAAAYALTRALERDIPARSATKWLLQAAFWVGCGFVTKMVAAWMILPALALAYLAGRNAGWGRKLLDLAAAAVVLLVSSLWWVALTMVWPGAKPFIGGSTDGTAWDLITGYNGLGRLLGQEEGASSSGGGGSFYGGDPGLFRMFGTGNGGQISWLIPLSLFALAVLAVAGLAHLRKRLPADRPYLAGWLLWGSWLGVIALVISYQKGGFQPYYTNQLAPAIAALTGAGLVVLWRYYRKPAGASWLLLPAGIALTAWWAWELISRDLSWHGWLRYAVVAAAVLAVAGLVLARLGTGPDARVTAAVLVTGLTAVLLAPGAWSVAKAFGPDQAFAAGGTISAGPPPAGSTGGTPGGLTGEQLSTTMRTGELPSGRRVGAADLSAEQVAMLDYVTKNAGSANIALAFEGGSIAASTYIINSDATVIGMGGFVGRDAVPTVDQLGRWQDDGQLAFVFGNNAKAPTDPFGGKIVAERVAWVRQHCTPVPASTYGGNTDPDASQLRVPNFLGGNADTLYNCLRR